MRACRTQIGVTAGILAMFYLTEYPAGFAHVTMESDLWLKARSQDDDDDEDAAGEGTTSSEGDGNSGCTEAVLVQHDGCVRRRLVGRLSFVIDDDRLDEDADEGWVLAHRHHRQLEKKWIHTASG